MTSLTVTPRASLTPLAWSRATRENATVRCGPIEPLNGVRGAVSGMAPWRSLGSRALRMILTADWMVRLMRPKASPVRRSLDSAA